MHTSSVGPHLDDFDIKLVYLNSTGETQGRDAEEAEYINLRNEGSLGQQRTATLALKLAEIFIYHKFYGEKPVLLLDDVLSELDFDRRRKLMEYCRHFDTIVTCTEWSYENPAPDTWYKVEKCTVTEMEVASERFTYQGEFNARAYEFAQKINEMADGYYEQQAWLEPVRNRVLASDTPRKDASRVVEFTSETVMKVMQEEQETVDLENIDFDPWNDEGKPLKKSQHTKK